MLNYVLNWIYPPKCIICENILQMDSFDYFCKDCENKLEIIEMPSCKICSRSVFEGKSICNRCKGEKYNFLKNYSMINYDDIAKEVLHNIKYRYKAMYGHKLGVIFGKFLKESGIKDEIDYIIPVPLYKSRERKRGFNQADILAKEIGAQLDKPVLYKLLFRVKNTVYQYELTKSQRSKNVEDAFLVKNKGKIIDKKLLLVDDIFTTGSTLNACSNTLLTSGCLHVICASLAIVPELTIEN